MAYNIIDAKNMYCNELHLFTSIKQKRPLTIEENEEMSRIVISINEIQKTMDLVSSVPVINIQQNKNGHVFKITEINPVIIENIYSFSETIFYLIKMCLKYDTKENIIRKTGLDFLNTFRNDIIILEELDSYTKTEKILYIVDLLKQYGIMINYNSKRTYGGWSPSSI